MTLGDYKLNGPRLLNTIDADRDKAYLMNIGLLWAMLGSFS